MTKLYSRPQFLAVLPILGIAAIAAIRSTFAQAPATGTSQIEAIFRRLDLDGDGKLTEDEAKGARWFKLLDRDGKGFVTLEQARLLGRLAEQRGAGDLDGGRGLPGTPEETAADESPREGPKMRKAAERGVGRLVPDLSFTDLAGHSGKLSDFKSSRALVIALTSTSCPLTKKYAPSLARLEKEFAGRGVSFLFVNPTATDSSADITAVLKDNGIAGRYVHDKEGRLTAALGAQTTTEVFVLDAARTLVFRGAVDDQYGLGYSLEAPRANFLKDALTALLAGRAPAVAATDAPGCAL